MDRVKKLAVIGCLALLCSGCATPLGKWAKDDALQAAIKLGPGFIVAVIDTVSGTTKKAVELVEEATIEEKALATEEESVE